MNQESETAIVRQNNANETSAAALFQGINSVTGEGLNTAVTGTSTSVDATDVHDYKLCITSEQLAEALDVSESVSVGIGLFGASEKVQLIKETQQTSFSLNLIIQTTSVISKQVAIGWAPKEGIKPLQDPYSARQFCVGHGDSFVYSITTGKEYVGILTVYATSESEKKTVITKLEASGLFNAFQFGADIQSKIDNFRSSVSVRIALHQRLMGVTGKALPSISEMAQFALDLPTFAIGNPHVLAVETRGYETVDGFQGFETIAANRKYFCGSGGKAGVHREYAQLGNLINQITTIQAVHACYHYDEPKLETVRTQAVSDQSEIDQQIQALYTTTTRFERPKLTSLTEGTPLLNHQADQSPAYGGTGGGQYDDVPDVEAFIAAQTRIKRLQIYRGNSFVDGLSITYSYIDSNGTTQERVEKHGFQTGTPEDLTLAADEWITTVSGRCDVYVDYLSFTTNKGRTVKTGRNGGNSFEWKADEGKVILGFRGWCGAYLDQIRMVYTVFQPSVWKKTI